MYVFITASELTGQEKQVALGQIEDAMPLQTLLERCLQNIAKYLPEENRNVSRHFWYNDRLLPFENACLRDVASTVNITLELRPDYYQVTLPRQSATRYAIDPELSTSNAIDRLLNEVGASRCYELLPQGGAALAEEKTLLQQATLPYHARLEQKESELVIRRKPQAQLWCALLVAGFVVAGLALGFVLAHLMK